MRSYVGLLRKDPIEISDCNHVAICNWGQHRVVETTIQMCQDIDKHNAVEDVHGRLCKQRKRTRIKCKAGSYVGIVVVHFKVGAEISLGLFRRNFKRIKSEFLTIQPLLVDHRATWKCFKEINRYKGYGDWPLERVKNRPSRLGSRQAVRHQTLTLAQRKKFPTWVQIPSSQPNGFLTVTVLSL